jgi:hypothetical protein
MELGKKEVRIQAEQFLGYFSKFKGRELEEVFRFWAESKDFDMETEKAIRREVDRILKERGQD